MGELASAHGTVFGWEIYHRNVAGRTMRKRLQTTVDLFAYLALPMVCTTAFWCSSTVQPLPLLTSLVQTLALVVLGWQFLCRAER